ncbi:DNA gyrase inhibitory protein [Cronobacter sakazakii 696]|nr:DNA gyrase inhibitory protein [Cronobacter sakazakii 696]
MPADFTLPENSVGVILTDLPGSQYAVRSMPSSSDTTGL